MGEIWSTYDQWKTSPPECDDVHVCDCLECKDELFEGDDVVESDDGIFCGEECFIDWVKKSLNMRLKELEMGDV